MKFIKYIKQIMLCGLIPLAVMNISFSSLEENLNTLLDQQSPSNISEGKNIINNIGLTSRESMNKNSLKSSNKNYERKVINNYISNNLSKDEEDSYVFNCNLAKKIIYERLFPNFCFFYYIKNSESLYFISNIFCWCSMIFFCIVFFLFCRAFGMRKKWLKKKDVLGEHDKILYKFILIILFITIMNGGLLGYKYSASGYNFFLNMILYPVATYLTPIFGSIFFVIFQPDYENVELIIYHITTMILTTFLLLLIGKRITDIKYMLEHKNEIKIINILIKESINKYSLSYNFIPFNFIYVYIIGGLCLVSIFFGIVYILNLIYVIIFFKKVQKEQELQKLIEQITEKQEKQQKTLIEKIDRAMQIQREEQRKEQAVIGELLKKQIETQNLQMSKQRQEQIVIGGLLKEQLKFQKFQIKEQRNEQILVLYTLQQQLEVQKEQLKIVKSVTIVKRN